MAKFYKMKLNGFKREILRGETVVVRNTEYGVCTVMNEDNTQDFIHMDDLEEIADAEKLSEPTGA